MTGMVWKPDVTVAAVIEREGRFLFVEERAGGRIVLNQPAGHLEDGETLIDAVVRETLEETACTFEPTGIVGVYLWKAETGQRTFLRIAFRGHLVAHHPERPLDRGILRTRWLTRDDLIEPRTRLRSPLVLACVDDWLGGADHPLSLLNHLIAAPSVLAASG
ncbi:MAG: NUDIX hydrolase [Steroidobacteraceae bacterium]